MHVQEDDIRAATTACLTRGRKWNLAVGSHDWREFHYKQTFCMPRDSLPQSNMHTTWPHLQSRQGHIMLVSTCLADRNVSRKNTILMQLPI